MCCQIDYKKCTWKFTNSIGYFGVYYHTLLVYCQFRDGYIDIRYCGIDHCFYIRIAGCNAYGFIALPILDLRQKQVL